MNCSSSFSGTKVSCLRSSRRKILLSFKTTPRAESGSMRISAETVLSVLNRKCGLIWLESASILAFNKSCWCRSRFISMRVLFQIFSGAATDISVAITTSPSHQSQLGSIAKRHLRFVACTSATRPSSSPMHVVSGAISQDNSALRSNFTVAFGMLKNVNGPKFQRSSLLGMACLIKPPSSPAADATGIASHSCEISAGMVTIAPPIGPTTRPPSKPIRNAPSSDRSANAYGWCPTKRSVTPTISGGVMNSINFNFWSQSRSSVNSTRRNVFHRASSAANDDATPTFSSKVNRRSRTEVALSIFDCVSQANASVSPSACKGVRGALFRPYIVSARSVRLAVAATPTPLCLLGVKLFLSARSQWQVRSAGLLYFSFPNEQKITTNQANEEKSLRRADGCACGVADALRPLHHLRIQRPRPAGRSCRSGARKSKGQDCATRARALAMPHGRRTHVPALRLPRAAGIVAEKDRAGAFGNSALSSTGRSRHRSDEQTPRLRTPGRRDGYRRSQRNAGFCRRCPRL